MQDGPACNQCVILYAWFDNGIRTFSSLVFSLLRAKVPNKWEPSGGHVTVFSNFKNGPAQSQTPPNNSLIIASARLPPSPFEVTRLTARSGVARQPNYGVQTLRTQDTSDLRQFGTSAEMSVGHFGPFIKCWETSALVPKCPMDISAPHKMLRQFGTSAEVSQKQFGTMHNTGDAR